MAPQRQRFSELFRRRIHNRVSPGGLTVLNKDGPKATIRIYDEIGFFGITAEEVAAELEQINAAEIEVQIASLGGDVFDGIAIYNALRAHPARISTRVDSMAASIASVIAQAGDTRIMLTGSQMMIHEAWGIAIGSAADMRDLADILDKQTDVIAGIYAERTGGDVADFRSMMEGETWFTADEALEAGLADAVITPASQDPPADRTDTKFTEHADSVIAEVERLVARAEEVIAFRTEQGKPPLSEDSVEAFRRLDDARNRLADAIASQPSDNTGPEKDELADELVSEYARFVHLTQGATT
jgi:ATP-dependent protease ClpP protease subunit